MNSPVTFSHWHTEPALIGGITFVSWCYSIIVGPYRSNFSANLPYSRKHTLWFCASMISFYLAVGSPLDPLGENFLFFAHMIQHNILMYVSPLFLLLGLPHEIVDHYLENKPILEKFLKVLISPYYCWLNVHSSFLLLAYRSNFMKLQFEIKPYTWLNIYLCFLHRWPCGGPFVDHQKEYHHAQYGPQMLYILAIMLGQTPIFAILTFSKDVLYDTYFYAERVMNLSPLEDQKTGGVL